MQRNASVSKMQRFSNIFKIYINIRYFVVGINFIGIVSSITTLAFNSHLLPINLSKMYSMAFKLFRVN